MKSIEVVAAVILKDGKVFATQRGYGNYKDWWEFPGGKIEKGESPEQALVREIQEELDAEILVGEKIKTVEWDYPEFHLTLHCFWCTLNAPAIHLNEHEAASWVGKEDIMTLRWLPADKDILEEIILRLP